MNIIVIIFLVSLFLFSIGRTKITYGFTTELLKDELDKRYKTENKFKLMRIKGVTINTNGG